MVRKKKVRRKPVTHVTVEESFTEREDETEDIDEVHSAEGFNLIAEMVRSQDILETENMSRSGSVRTQSWVEEVEDAMKMNVEKQQTLRSAKQTWEAFTNEKSLNRDQQLLFTEPLIRDGIKIAQVDLEEVQEEEKNWNTTVICKVLGANPPVSIFEGFIKRVWGHLGVVQVSKLSMGMIMVRFNDEATRDQVVEAGIVQFDRKPVIVRPRSVDLNAMNLVRTVPLWIRLQDLGLQYWGTKSSSALVITIGKPIMVDQHTNDQTWSQYAGVLVEMEIMDEPPRFIPYFNEFGQLQDQKVEYEWLPAMWKEKAVTKSHQEWVIPKNTVPVTAAKQPGNSKEIAESSNNVFHLLQQNESRVEKQEWTDNFPKTKAHYSWETISDHCLCFVSTTTNVEIGYKPFRYYNFWADHSEFKDVVLDSWQKPMRREGVTGLYLKLMRLKHSIKRFNRERVGDIGKIYQEARDLYIQARTQAQDQPRDTTVQQIEKETALNFNTQEKMYHSFLRQRSNVTWLSKGDENNAFFHSFLKKKRRMENSIVTYTNDYGEVVDNFSEVVKHFIKHFQGYMGTSTRPTQDLKKECMEMGNKLNREQQLALIKPFSTKEIKEALFSIPDTKSPGPDGYGVGFFKTLWPEIGAEFTKAVENFFLTGLVNQNQGAFVQGRSIAHNVMILQDLLKNYKRKNISPRCTIKVDISKAYDTVNWEFLEKLLKEFNLPGRFITWIMTCLKSTSYSILMNGRVQGSFQGKKGLRQGDPLSPLLFVLIMEYLTRRLLLAANHSEFRYQPLCKNLKIINLSFADDLMIFCKGDLGSIQIIKQILDEFSATSGLSININKSHLYFGGVKDEEKQKMVKELSLQEGEFPLKDKFTREDIHKARAGMRFKAALLYNSSIPQTLFEYSRQGRASAAGWELGAGRLDSMVGSNG
uniref:Reverse transcriptase domain-containing protein n=1 Tax=Cannabis sativa TaxID=3483 RepID=A0A803Q8U7_CANSA